MTPTHHLVLSLSCNDRPGIVHSVTGVLARFGGNVTESQQFGDAGTGHFYIRVQVDQVDDRAALEADLADSAAVADGVLAGTSVHRELVFG